MSESANKIKIVDLTGAGPAVVTRRLIEDEPTDRDLLAAYQTLRGEQRRTFFQQHAAALLRAHRSGSPSV